VLEVLIGSAVGTFGVYFWSWRRARAARAQERSSTTEFERTLRRARDNFAVAKYSVPLDSHAPLVALLAATNPDCETLLGAGFKPLGDVVIEGVDRDSTMIVRALVSADGTTIALLSVPRHATTRVMLGFTSHSPDEMFSTRRGPLPSLAEPAFAHRQTLAPELPIVELIARHGVFTRAARSAFIQIANRTELIAELHRAREQIVNWRNAQPSDVLLEADLQAVLGESYEHFGPLWMHRLRGRLPRATLRAKLR
jgi:hypothetical protein